MAMKEAEEIAGTLTKTTKMPGYSYGLDAFQCHVGSELAKMPGSTCENCFARRDLYLWKHTRAANKFRTKAITHPLWDLAMVELIANKCSDQPWFRWHDSGDLMSVQHLVRIARVCMLTPDVQHWLPTREYSIVQEFLRAGGEIPANLTIRLSAWFVEERPDIPAELEHLTTSTVHSHDLVQLGRRKDSVACRAQQRGNECGPCRACWSAKVKNISYPLH